MSLITDQMTRLIRSYLEGIAVMSVSRPTWLIGGFSILFTVALVMAVHPQTVLASTQIISGSPGCTNNLSYQSSSSTVVVRGNMAGCLRANLTFYITANDESSGTNYCSNSTECSRPAFTFTAPPNACVTVVTEAVGHSSKFSSDDYVTRTFGVAAVTSASRTVFHLRGPDAIC